MRASFNRFHIPYGFVDPYAMHYCLRHPLFNINLLSFVAFFTTKSKGQWQTPHFSLTWNISQCLGARRNTLKPARLSACQKKLE